MGFEFSSLFSETFDCEYKPNENVPDGEGLQLKLNVDVLTYDFLKFSKTKFLEAKEQTKEKKQSEAAEKQINLITDEFEFMARTLGGQPGEDDKSKRVIVDWNMQIKGSKVEVSYDFFLKWGYTSLQSLFNFCVYEAGKPTKKNETPSASI